MEYEVLGIPENSSLEDAKKALKKIRIDHHPDKNVNK
jgi:DnaJ-class molecular chaperone